MDLCNKVGGQLIQKVVQATAKDRNVDYLQFLCNLVKMGSTYIKKNQDIVMQEVSNITESFWFENTIFC